MKRRIFQVLTNISSKLLSPKCRTHIPQCSHLRYDNFDIRHRQSQIVLTGIGERKSVRPPEVTLIRLVGGANPVGIVITVTRAATFTYQQSLKSA
jgi:hypothetical protein